MKNRKFLFLGSFLFSVFTQAESFEWVAGARLTNERITFLKKDQVTKPADVLKPGVKVKKVGITGKTNAYLMETSEGHRFVVSSKFYKDYMKASSSTQSSEQKAKGITEEEKRKQVAAILNRGKRSPSIVVRPSPVHGQQGQDKGAISKPVAEPDPSILKEARGDPKKEKYDLSTIEGKKAAYAEVAKVYQSLHDGLMKKFGSSLKKACSSDCNYKKPNRCVSKETYKKIITYIRDSLGDHNKSELFEIGTGAFFSFVKTAYDEARGFKQKSEKLKDSPTVRANMVGVMRVMFNRSVNARGSAGTIAQVATQDRQFSGWNRRDPNFACTLSKGVENTSIQNSLQSYLDFVYLQKNPQLYPKGLLTATHYHAAYVKPAWKDERKKLDSLWINLPPPPEKSRINIANSPSRSQHHFYSSIAWRFNTNIYPGSEEDPNLKFKNHLARQSKELGIYPVEIEEVDGLIKPHVNEQGEKTYTYYEYSGSYSPVAMQREARFNKAGELISDELVYDQNGDVVFKTLQEDDYNTQDTQKQYYDSVKEVDESA